MDNNYLAHHGVLGQKWGIRRYRNRDGSLTPAGKRHEAKLRSEVSYLKSEADKVKKVSAQKDEDAPKETPAFKPLSEMTTDELRNAVARYGLEQQYLKFINDANNPNRELELAVQRLELQNRYNDANKKLNPKKESFAKTYVENLEKTLASGISSEIANLGKQTVAKLMNGILSKSKK